MPSRTGRPATAIIAILLGTTPVAASAVDPLQAKVDAIRDRFVSAVRACGVTPAFVPMVHLETGPAVISYDGHRQTLFIGRYEALPPPIQRFFTEWAAHDMPGKSPAFLFDTLFNDFLVGHELGHWVDDLSGRINSLDRYDGETEANRIAIAFAGLRPADIQDRDAKVAAFSYLATLPNPVPPGVDPRHWFNAHYDHMIDQNPIAYNWFQGVFMTHAWAMRSAEDFCSLVRLKPNDPG